jgi:membrane protein implicated in regulation of membrane protease activity
MGIRPMAGPDRPPFTRADITASGTRLETKGEIPGAFGRESCLNANSMKAVPCPTRPRPARNLTAAGAIALAGAVSLAASGEAEPDGATAFFVYAVCFGVGLLFTVVSAVAGHAFGGHGDLGHEAGGHGAGGHGQGHAEGGDNPGDMPGFSPLSPTTIASFVTAFGGFGMIFSQLDTTRSVWISGPLAAVGALAIAAGVLWLFRTIFRKTQASSEGRVADLAGLEATVITPITADRVGEIAYVQLGSRYSAPARAEGGVTFANGATVKITRVVGTQFYVATP